MVFVLFFHRFLKVTSIKIDLHVHTTFSDGTLTPREVVCAAQSVGLRAIAITDHDTLRGNDDAMDEGKKLGVEVVPGVEVSVDFPGGTMHVLGYYVDLNCDPFIKVLERIENGRHERNMEILDKLGRLGMPLDYDEIRAVASEGPIGRPHIAQTMIRRNHVASVREAFDKYLKKGAPAYADRLRFSEEEAVESICQAGGVAVLAHPGSLNCSSAESLAAIVERAVSVGLQGLEAYYPSHSSEMQRICESLAEQYGLLLTGGTDFHGTIFPENALGSGYGDLSVPYSLLEEMKATVAGNRRRGAGPGSPELRAET